MSRIRWPKIVALCPPLCHVGPHAADMASGSYSLTVYAAPTVQRHALQHHQGFAPLHAAEPIHMLLLRGNGSMVPVALRLGRPAPIATVFMCLSSPRSFFVSGPSRYSNMAASPCKLRYKSHSSNNVPTEGLQKAITVLVLGSQLKPLSPKPSQALLPAGQDHQPGNKTARHCLVSSPSSTQHCSSPALTFHAVARCAPNTLSHITLLPTTPRKHVAAHGGGASRAAAS